ncbi:MAG: hypothetical protein VW600_00170 [Ferrovibrio sp.]
MPHSIARLSPGLLERLYLGAVDEDELKPFLSELARSCNASLATFACMDGRTRQDCMRVTRHDDHRDYAGAVPGHYAMRSPFRPMMMLDGNFGRVLTSTDMVSLDRRRRDVFINEFLKPTDHEYLVTSVFERSGDQYSYFVLNRGGRFGEFDETEVSTLQALVPHMRTMLRLRNSMVPRERYVSFSQTMADRSGDGLVLLDRHGRVHSMNARAADTARQHHCCAAAFGPSAISAAHDGPCAAEIPFCGRRSRSRRANRRAPKSGGRRGR